MNERQYYRISDRVALDYQVIASDAPLPEDSRLFALLAELHTLDFESQHLLRHVTERDRPLAAYMRVLGKRIDLLSQVVMHSLPDQWGAPRAVTLSEGGIGFSIAEALEPGTQLALRLVLLPDGLGLLLRAEVSDCRAMEGGEYELNCAFIDLNDAQRQLLARHVIKIQAQERRRELE